MTIKVMNIDNMNTVLATLRNQGYTIIGPVQEEKREVYKTITDPSELVHEYTLPQNSVKDVLFPQCEPLCKFTPDEIIEVTTQSEKTVVFGIRPCDASAVARLDRLFNWDSIDTYYNARRQNVILIALACHRPGPFCFCTSLGGGPHDASHVDIMLTRLNDEYLIEPCSSEGKELLDRWPNLRPATHDHHRRAHQCREQSETRIVHKVDIPQVAQTLDDHFTSLYWQEVAQQCIGCGICTYLCPTCHCFDILDEDDQRVKIWDSCQFALYTKHATGHNPRKELYKRFRNRIQHKFVYFKKNLGEYLCVGCGRCTTYCPTNIDILTVITDIEAST